MVERFFVKTKGHTDFVNLTSKIGEIVSHSQIKEGIVLIFVKSSTCALTTMEWEEGIKKDIKSVLEKVIPEGFDWEHHKKWGDHNGSAHIRSALIGTDLAIPVENGELILGTWQQIVLIDFDEREREREIVVKIIPEE